MCHTSLDATRHFLQKFRVTWDERYGEVWPAYANPGSLPLAWVSTARSTYAWPRMLSKIIKISSLEKMAPSTLSVFGQACQPSLDTNHYVIHFLLRQRLRRTGRDERFGEDNNFFKELRIEIALNLPKMLFCKSMPRTNFYIFFKI